MVRIDPEEKIFIIEGTSSDDSMSMDVQVNLYSEWKRWVIEDADRLKYPPAFRASGGENIALDGSQVSPRYFFLINNWRIKVKDIDLKLSLNLYSEVGSPFILENATIESTKSDIGIITLNSNPNGNSSGAGILDELISEHLQEGTFGELLQKTFLAAAKASE